jgi:tetratricopeptide (TPR) repeat protein
VYRLVFLNRAPVSANVWDEANRNELDARQLIALDTLIVNNIFRGVQEVLLKSPLSQFHMPIWLNDRRLDTFALEDRILTRREVDNICDTIGGDVIISLEYYYAGLKERTEYYRDAPKEVQNSYYEAFNKLKWNIHLPGSPTPFNSYVTADTLFFPEVIDGSYVGPNPTGLEMVRNLFYDSGFKYGTYLVPVWNQTSRTLYRGKGEYLREAAKHTDMGDWETAYTIWRDLSFSADSTLAAKAWHNLAIYYELEDRLDSASIMLDRALKLDQLDVMQMYREDLDVRILNRSEIEKQVN